MKKLLLIFLCLPFIFISCNQAEFKKDVSEQNIKNTSEMIENIDNEIEKQKCVSGDCENGFGTFTDTNGTYVGEFKDGKFHGEGTFTYNAPTSPADYVVRFEEPKNEVNSINELLTETKVKHEKKERIKEETGNWKNGKLNGYGSRVWTKVYEKTHQQKYVGNFKDGKPDGYGTKWYNWGDYFKGDFDCCSGEDPTQEGTMFYLDGTSKYGAWETFTSRKYSY